MNRFLVAQCPHCGEIQAFYASYKSKLCNRCGRKFTTNNCKNFGIYDNARVATEVVKNLKMKVKNGRYNYP